MPRMTTALILIKLEMSALTFNATVSPSRKAVLYEPRKDIFTKWSGTWPPLDRGVDPFFGLRGKSKENFKFFGGVTL